MNFRIWILYSLSYPYHIQIFMYLDNLMGLVIYVYVSSYYAPWPSYMLHVLATLALSYFIVSLSSTVNTASLMLTKFFLQHSG